MRALLYAFLLVAANAAAAPFAVQVGETRIALDTPAGLADTGFLGSPRLQEFAETLTSASNRILLFALTDSDLRRFSIGDAPNYRRYGIVYTPKAMERERVTPAVFQRFVGDSLREFGPQNAPGADLVKHFEALPEGLMVLFGELRRQPQAFSVMQGMRLPPPPPENIFSLPPPQYVLASTSLVHLRGKAVSVALFTLYETKADEDWLRATTGRWIDELQRLNAPR